MYVNKVILIGNLTRDPELKSLPSGVKVCSFSIATNEVYMKDNKKIEKVEFHNIVCFGRTAENVGQYMVKGSQLYIEGKLQTRSWEAKETGEKKYRTEILAERVQFGRKPAGTAAAPAQERSARPAAAKEKLDQEYPGEAADPIEYPEEDLSPEDIPF